MTGLHWAASRNLEGLVDVLINFYSDPIQYDQLGRTALYYAVRNNNYRIIKKLLQARSLPKDDFHDMSTLTEDFVTKRLLSIAKFVLNALKMVPAKSKYRVWGPAITFWLSIMPLN